MRTKDCALMHHHHTSKHRKQREVWEAADLQEDFHHSGWAPCSSPSGGGSRKGSESKRAAGDSLEQLHTDSCLSRTMRCPVSFLAFQRPLTQGQDKAGPFVN